MSQFSQSEKLLNTILTASKYTTQYSSSIYPRVYVNVYLNLTHANNLSHHGWIERSKLTFPRNQYFLHLAAKEILRPKNQFGNLFKILDKYIFANKNNFQKMISKISPTNPQKGAFTILNIPKKCDHQNTCDIEKIENLAKFYKGIECKLFSLNERLST